MTTKQTFQSLGSIACVMGKWIQLRQWAVRHGFADTAANAESWIRDCKARAARINKLGGGL